MLISAKIKWVLGILVVFVLIVSTNLIDRNNFLRVKESMESIYEDRLVANDLIFDMSQAIQLKELAVAKGDSMFFKSQKSLIDSRIEEDITRYGSTKLTKEEEELFTEFKSNFEILKKLELSYVQNGFKEKKPVSDNLALAHESLYKLSKIQLSEGGKQLSLSNKAIDKIELFTSMEIYLLIFLAIVIQIVIISSPKKETEQK